MSYELNDLIKDIEEASDFLESARHETSVARSREIMALNKLNELQKKFDAAVKTMKEEAPRDSGWRRDKGVTTE